MILHFTNIEIVSMNKEGLLVTLFNYDMNLQIILELIYGA